MGARSGRGGHGSPGLWSLGLCSPGFWIPPGRWSPVLWFRGLLPLGLWPTGRRGWALILSLLLGVAGVGTAAVPEARAAMDYAKQSLIGADFHAADLRGVTFNLTNLREANLSGADLRGASLFGAKLQDADLRGADLRGATLDGAVLEGTDLRDSRLEDAFAFNTRFLDVRIEGADFTNVPLRGDARKALCAAAAGTNPASGRTTRDTLECG